MKRFKLAAITVVLSLSLSAMAQAAAGPARAKLDAFAENLHSLTGHFSQTLTDTNGQTSKPAPARSHSRRRANFGGTR